MVIATDVPSKELTYRCASFLEGIHSIAHKQLKSAESVAEFITHIDGFFRLKESPQSVIIFPLPQHFLEE